MGNYTVAGTFGSHLAECWSFLRICTVDVKIGMKTHFFGIPYLKRALQNFLQVMTF